MGSGDKRIRWSEAGTTGDDSATSSCSTKIDGQRVSSARTTAGGDNWSAPKTSILRDPSFSGEGIPAKAEPRYAVPRHEIILDPRQDPRKIRLGKKANIGRDLSVAFVVLAVLFYFTNDWSAPQELKQDQRHTKSDHKKMIQEKYQAMKDSVARDMHEKIESTRRLEACSLYLHKSSIPGVSRGIYAGKDYASGEVVLRTSTTTLGMVGKGGEPLSISSYGFLINHHPFLANVQGPGVLSAEGWIELRATRRLQAGEELFLPYDAHPASKVSVGSMLESIPKAEDYRKADEIMRDLKLTANRMRVSQGRQGILLDTSFLFSFTRRTISQFDPNLIHLIPGSRKDDDSRPEGPIALTALQNTTLYWLQAFGRCLDTIYVETPDDGVSVSDLAAMVNEDINEGMPIAPAPLFVSNETVAGSFSIAQTGYHLSILTNAAFAKNDLEPNADIRWHDSEKRPSSLEEMLNAPAGTFAMEIVALHHLSSGTKVR